MVLKKLLKIIENIMKIKHPLSTDTWDKKEFSAITNVLKSNLMTQGKYVKKFEKNFSNYLGTKYSVMVNSGSSANLLMIASLFYTKNIKKKLFKGDEVIVPSIGWSTSYFPLYQYGLKLKFVDVDLHTLNFDIEKLEKAINKRTRLVFAVNVCGNSNDFSKILKLTRNKNILLLEDNCESLGSEYKNKKTGSFGLMSSCSFYYSHHISTIEGGMISTNDKELYQILLSLRSHGWIRDLPKKNLIKNKSNDDFNNSFSFLLPGYNLRSTEINASAGIHQLKKLPHLIRKRRKNASLYKNIFKESMFITQKEIGKSSSFWFTFIIKKDFKIKRDDLIKKLKNFGVECRPIVSGNFVRNKVCKYLNFKVYGELKNADYISKNGFAIGNNHHDLSKNLKKIKLFFDKISR
tara:strand:+ start:320 stop:1537 length:1218 start_codon:yes stop_codon:yes gene_type:complete